MEHATKQITPVTPVKEASTSFINTTPQPFFRPVSAVQKLVISDGNDCWERQANEVAAMINKDSGLGGANNFQITAVNNSNNISDDHFVSDRDKQLINEIIVGGGHSMEYSTKLMMEWLFNENFSNVRIHSDLKAHESSRRLQARAYTYDQHIVFKQSAFDPHSRSGINLLAHELTHTLQQRAGEKLIQRMPDSLVDYVPYFRKNIGAAPAI